jgi:hypothetical protein
LGCYSDESISIKYVLDAGYSKEVSGTYVHPQLINSVAMWNSPKYQLKVNRIMNAINEKGQLTNNPNYIDDHLKELLEENERLKERIQLLEEENDNLKPRAVLDDHKEKYYVVAIKDEKHVGLNETKINFHRVHEKQLTKQMASKNEYISDPKPISMSYFHEYKLHLESNHRNMYRFALNKVNKKKPTTIIFNNMVLGKAFDDLDRLLNEFEN